MLGTVGFLFGYSYDIAIAFLLRKAKVPTLTPAPEIEKMFIPTSFSLTVPRIGLRSFSRKICDH